jgi:hypothetical protein
MIDDNGVSAIMPVNATGLTKRQQRPDSLKRRQKNSTIIIAFPLISALCQPI